MERELTHEEMKKAADAVYSSLPEDATGNGVVLFFTANTQRGFWVSRISSLSKDDTNDVITRWVDSIKLNKKFGKSNPN